MNTNAKLHQVVEPGNAQFKKLICNSVSATLGLALATAGILIAVPSANGQTTVTTADKDFLLAAAQGGMTEVKLGELAARNGSRDDVKEFGRMMVKDHTRINEDLRALAAEKGVILADTVDAKHQEELDKMAALTPAGFDEAYIAAMIKGHKTVAKEFKAEAVLTQDPDIKSFLEKSAPVVEGHLKHAAAMNK